MRIMKQFNLISNSTTTGSNRLNKTNPFSVRKTKLVFYEKCEWHFCNETFFFGSCQSFRIWTMCRNRVMFKYHKTISHFKFKDIFDACWITIEAKNIEQKITFLLKHFFSAKYFVARFHFILLRCNLKTTYLSHI